MAKQKEEISEEPKPKNERFEVVEVPVETGQFVRDNNNEEIFTDKRVLAEILNKLDKIEKAVA